MKQWIVSATLLVLAAGCSSEDRAPGARDSAGQPVEQSATPKPTAPPAAAEAAETQVPPAHIDPASAQAAAEVVRRYYALLADGDYGAAYELWKGETAAMSRAAFAQSFAKFSSYDAVIGQAGRLDPGAGNVHVEIPVRVQGLLKTGAPFVLEGPVRLHRVNDVPGSTADQRTWHIVASGVRPRPES